MPPGHTLGSLTVVAAHVCLCCSCAWQILRTILKEPPLPDASSGLHVCHWLLVLAAPLVPLLLFTSSWTDHCVNLLVRPNWASVWITGKTAPPPELVRMRGWWAALLALIVGSVALNCFNWATAAFRPGGYFFTAPVWPITGNEGTPLGLLEYGRNPNVVT